jgi:hypothetical protein
MITKKALFMMGTTNGSNASSNKVVDVDAVWVQLSGSGRCDNIRSGFKNVLLSANLG